MGGRGWPQLSEGRAAVRGGAGVTFPALPQPTRGTRARGSGVEALWG